MTCQLAKMPSSPSLVSQASREDQAHKSYGMIAVTKYILGAVRSFWYEREGLTATFSVPSLGLENATRLAVTTGEHSQGLFLKNSLQS